MKTTYNFDENDIKEALKEKFLNNDKNYSIKIEQVEAENYYGDKYTTIIATATEF